MPTRSVKVSFIRIVSDKLSPWLECVTPFKYSRQPKTPNLKTHNLTTIQFINSHMKHIITVGFEQLLIILLTLIVMSCGVSGDRLKIEGRFLQLNQGEFYVYSNDGLVTGIDTIKIRGGRFVYDIPCEQEGILMIVFPNFSEQPIFAKPGESIDIKADASRLREMEVTGTKENELMTEFRELIVHASPPEIVKHAAHFITEHPQSIVSKYLIRKYFLASPTPNFKQGLQLVRLMRQQLPDDNELTTWQKTMESLANTSVGSILPKFSATTVKGEKVSDKQLREAPVAVIHAWATDHYVSMDMQRIIRTKLKSSGGRLKALSICLDPSKKMAMQTIERDSIGWANICDEMMFDGKLAKQLAIYSLPQTLLIKKGKIVKKNVSREKLEEEIDQLLR